MNQSKTTTTVSAKHLPYASFIHHEGVTRLIVRVEVISGVIRCQCEDIVFDFKSYDQVRVTYLNGIQAKEFYEGIWIKGPYQQPICLRNIKRSPNSVSFTIQEDPSGLMIGMEAKCHTEDFYERVPYERTQQCQAP